MLYNLKTASSTWEKSDARIQLGGLYVDDYVKMDPDSALLLAEEGIAMALPELENGNDSFFNPYIELLLIKGYALRRQQKHEEVFRVFSMIKDSILSRNDSSYLADVYNIKGNWYGSDKQDFDSSYWYYAEADRLAIKYDRHKVRGWVAGNTVLRSRYSHDYLAADSLYELAYKSFKAANFGYGMASSRHQKAGWYRQNSNYSLALVNYKEALDLYQQLGNSKKMFYTLRSLASIYNSVGDTSIADLYYQQADSIFKANPFYEHRYSLAYGKLNRAINDEKFDSAMIYLDEVALLIDTIALTSKRGAFDRRFYLERARARILFYRGDKEEGYAAMKGLLDKIRSEHSHADIIISFLYTKANMEWWSKDYAAANQSCKEVYELALKLRNVRSQKNACYCLQETYYSMGDFKSAYKYSLLHSELQDSLRVLRNKDQLGKQLLTSAFHEQAVLDSLKQKEQERETELAHQEEIRKKNRIRNIFIGSGLMALLLAGGFYSRWMYVKRSKAELEVEKERSEGLLLNILPEEVSNELKMKGVSEPQEFEKASILFTDFKGFTQASSSMSARELIEHLNEAFKAFDHIIQKYGIEKIKTIGDAYMAAGGLPVPSKDSTKNTLLAALEMQQFMIKLHKEKEDKGEHAFEMRVGIHTGPVIAGIVGVKKFQYDVWGDTVNTASRMESNGEVGKVNISQATYELIKDDPHFTFEHRGKVEAKGKGEMDMWFVSLL